MPNLITIIKMVGSRVVVIYCKFYKPKSQGIGIKIYVSLWIASYSCNVVYTEYTFIHGTVFTPYSFALLIVIFSLVRLTIVKKIWIVCMSGYIGIDITSLHQEYPEVNWLTFSDWTRSRLKRDNTMTIY